MGESETRHLHCHFYAVKNFLMVRRTSPGNQSVWRSSRGSSTACQRKDQPVWNKTEGGEERSDTQPANMFTCCLFNTFDSTRKCHLQVRKFGSDPAGNCDQVSQGWLDYSSVCEWENLHISLFEEKILTQASCLFDFASEIFAHPESTARETLQSEDTAALCCCGASENNRSSS